MHKHLFCGEQFPTESDAFAHIEAGCSTVKAYDAIKTAIGCTAHGMAMIDIDECTGRIATAARNGELPYDYYTAAHGLVYARETCRVSGETETRLRRMDGAKTARLIARIAAACPTIADVPRWINANLDATC